MADLARDGFEGVKTTLRLVEKAACVFPPLQSAVAGLLGVIDIVEVRSFQLNIVIVMVLTVPQTTSQNQRDRQDLEQKLTAVVSVINNYSTTPTFTSRLEGLSA